MGYVAHRTVEIVLPDELTPDENGVIPGSDGWWEGPWTVDRFIDTHLRTAMAVGGEWSKLITVRVLKD